MVDSNVSRTNRTSISVVLTGMGSSNVFITATFLLHIKVFPKFVIIVSSQVFVRVITRMSSVVCLAKGVCFGVGSAVCVLITDIIQDEEILELTEWMVKHQFDTAKVFVHGVVLESHFESKLLARCDLADIRILRTERAVWT